MDVAQTAAEFGNRGRSPAELENVWSALLSTPEIAISVIRLGEDNQFRFTEMNFASAHYANHPWHSMRGMTVHEALIPQVRDHLESMLRLCVETGEAQHYERAVDLPTGRIAWAANLIPIRDHGSGIREVVTMARPIPIEMHSSGIDTRNRYLVEGLNGSPAGLIFLWDPVTHRAIFVGGQVEGLLGFKPYQLEEMNDPLSSLVHPEDLARVTSRLAVVVADHSDAISVLSCRVRQSDGCYRHLAFNTRVLDRSADGTARTLLGVANDVTSEELLKDEIALLSARLSNAQMDERRLIAQELHDSAGQYLIAAELALICARERCPELSKNLAAAGALEDVRVCLKDAEREIRVLTYLLHPPALSAPTPSTALRNFATGFGGRAGIVMDVTIDKKLDKAAPHLAIPLLRVCQEALSNVHRHAKAKSVSVKLGVTGDGIKLEISDDGIGFRQHKRSDKCYGLGLSGMRDRIEQLGGSLSIESDHGTCLTAVIPIVDQ